MLKGVNWREYLRQYDLIYEMPATVWQDGMPLGNGSLGALAYEPFHPEWVINKNDVWDYRHPEFKRHTMTEMREIVARDKNYMEEMEKEDPKGMHLYPCPKTCGQLRIRFGYDSIFTPGHRTSKRLSLHEATLYTSLDKHLSHPRITSFICAEQDVLVIRVRDISAMTAFRNKVDLFRMPDSQLPDSVRGAKGDTIWIEQSFPDGFRYVMMARIVPKGGSTYRKLFKETVQKRWWHLIEPSKKIESAVDGQYAVASVAGDFDIFLTVVTTLQADDPQAAAKEKLEAAVRKGSGMLHVEHCRWWAKFWPQSRVSLDEPLLEQLWYVSLYNLACVSRGTPVGGLCGLWYGPMDTPSQILPWKGYYTNDYNAQLPVMPVFRVNHPELADGAFRTLFQQLPGARRNAAELYRLPGAYYPVSTDPTGDEVSSGPYRFCQGSGPYWSVFLWWHYLYTHDKEYLRRVSYPIMREVAIFFTSYLVWHEDEKLYHLEISQNPELMYVKYPDPIDTLSLLKYTLRATVEAARILQRDKDLAVKCRHVLNHYPPYPRYEKEFSPLKGLRSNHITHLRTLSALIPCGEFDPEVAPGWYGICRSEINKMDLWSKQYACNLGRMGGYTGFVYHIGMPACWLGLKDIAWGYMEDLLKANVKPNGLISHNSAVLADSALSEKNIKNIPGIALYHDFDPEPLKAAETLNGRFLEQTTENLDCRDTMFPAFEGPAVYLFLLNEMLLQSHNGILRVFPGLPDNRDASFTDFRAEGPTLVSASKVKGKVHFVRLKAKRTVSWKLKNPWHAKAVWRRIGRSKRVQKIEVSGYIRLDLTRGEEVTLALSRQDLSKADLPRMRTGEKPQARSLAFSDGMVVWLGKPQPSQYYASLEAARLGKPQPERSR